MQAMPVIKGTPRSLAVAGHGSKRQARRLSHSSKAMLASQERVAR